MDLGTSFLFCFVFVSKDPVSSPGPGQPDLVTPHPYSVRRYLGRDYPSSPVHTGPSTGVRVSRQAPTTPS